MYLNIILELYNSSITEDLRHSKRRLTRSCNNFLWEDFRLWDGVCHKIESHLMVNIIVIN
jgi:hypothetical protein